MAYKINPTLIIEKHPHRPGFHKGNRTQLDKYISNLPSGTEITSGTLSKMFNFSSGGTVGGLLRQREDLERLQKGYWRKK